MTDLQFDLNIHNYSLHELEDIIELHRPYNFNLIQIEALAKNKYLK